MFLCVVAAPAFPQDKSFVNPPGSDNSNGNISGPAFPDIWKSRPDENGKTVVLNAENAVDPETGQAAARPFPDSVIARAGDAYHLNKGAYRWLGKNYRQVWAAPVKVPVFDLNARYGGLKILKQGGGQQTLSLRLEDGQGRQYVLRSIDKNVAGALPEDLLDTFAEDLVQDQISASNPYAAPVVAKLAGYAGIFHTNPEIVYLPDDPAFGVYRQDVAGKLFLFEERPEGDQSHNASFGNSKDVISTAKVVRNTMSSARYLVDQDAVLRARLFDILINDWDRHDDQWRWASFKQQGFTVYKPIPRDRDQAFFVNEGLLPKMASRNWILPKTQGFREYTKNMEGHAMNARYFDRYFLTQKGWDDWKRQVDSLRASLTPARIDASMRAFPEEVYPLCAPETARILKARLGNLEAMARELYLSLANEVSITGTEKDNLFEISAVSQTALQITGYEYDKQNNPGKQFFSRVFNEDETQLIHIYGLGGNDRFLINGNIPKKMKINLIGGDGTDESRASKEINPAGITVYDEMDTGLSPELNGRLRHRVDQEALKYDREHFQRSYIYPGYFFGYNPDDGVFLGGGAAARQYSRYRQQQYKLLGNFAPATNAWNLQFGAAKTYPLYRTEGKLLIGYNSPEYAGNFFGMGNNTKWEVPRSRKAYYRLRMARFTTEADFSRWLDSGKKHKMGPGFYFTRSEIELTEGRFIANAENGLSEDDLKSHTYTGLLITYELNTHQDAGTEPEDETGIAGLIRKNGSHLKTRAGYYFNLSNNTNEYIRLSADWTAFANFPQQPRLVYSISMGGEKLFGDYPFYEAAKLGNGNHLRGYRTGRFHGDASFYLNSEMRLQMKHLQSYFMNGTGGILLFNDLGRVWYKGEHSRKWHNGTGAGIWFAPFNMALVSVSCAFSTEDVFLSITAKYRF